MTDTKEQTDKYNGCTFHTWYDGEHAGTWVYEIMLADPQRKFWTGEDSIDSDEYYDSYEQAHQAACDSIDRMQDGPNEPDYDAPTSSEMYQRAHEDRQKLRRR